jgi:hypothetical protein
MISMTDFDDDESYFESFKELSYSQHKIELMLNPKEDDHNDIVDSIDDIRDIVHDEKIDEDKMNEILDEKIEYLMKVSKRVFKREWERVKNGK